ncbi:MAG TPA: heavy-metal-associated domain-containing protein [Catalimonadaceae bacterium]|nr:heavy-metal-associated domain-containing protein [Catalimonadaceae bacterium]
MEKVFKFLTISFFIFSFFSCNAQEKGAKKVEKATFKVWGNCDMCKTTIESAADVKGVKSANWNVDSKMFSVTFNPDKISLDKIHELIAASGYDTDKLKGDDKAYAALPDCCHYERRK